MTFKQYSKVLVDENGEEYILSKDNKKLKIVYNAAGEKCTINEQGLLNKYKFYKFQIYGIN